MLALHGDTMRFRAISPTAPTPDPTEDQNERFVTQMTAAQPTLYAFILSLVPNANDARDVLSETNLALWKKREEFDPTMDYWPWACRFARLQVLAFRKRQQRDRLVLADEVVDLIAAKAEQAGREWKDSMEALESCLDELEEGRAQILRRRYSDGLSIAQIAGELGKTVGAVADLLYRLRLRLASCIERKLAVEG
jgi:RNA polymerase sigma-70 factor (ECF subfamily)